MGELLCPLPGAGLSGGCLPCEAPGGTTTVAVASSGALDSAPAGTTELSVFRGLDAPGAGPLICSARGRSVLAVLGPPGLCLSRGEAGSWAVSRALCSRACAVGFALPAAQPPPWGAAARAPPSCSWDPPWVLQSFRELGALSPGQVSVSVPGSLRASPPSWGPALTPCEPLSAREDW